LERVERGRYRIGIRLWRIGSLAPAAPGLRDAALPFLQDLSSATGHYVHPVVAGGPHKLFVRAPARRVPAGGPSQGRGRRPLPGRSRGKVLLAHSSPEFVERVVALGLPRMARRTITDRDQLVRALADIRNTGYCVSRDEMTDGTSSVAAPIVGATGEV